MKVKILLSLLFATFINNFEGYSQPTKVSTKDFILGKMDSLNIVGAQAMVMKKGTIAFNEVFGYKNLKDSTLVDNKTLFMMASSSKPVTSLAMMYLIDEGMANLDDDINKYLPFKFVNPYFPNIPTTIRHLLTHTSGIRDNWSFLNDTYTHEKGGGDSPISLDSMAKSYFLPTGTYYKRRSNFHGTKPGGYWQYSNIGFAMVGYLVEQISGQPFNEFCKQKIFLPLDMQDTYWTLQEIPHDNIARPYDGEQILPHYGYVSYPDGQLRTTATDYLKFMQLFMQEGKVKNRPFLKTETIREFLKIQNPIEHEYQAIGWQYNGIGSKDFYKEVPHLPGHNGGDPGVSTWVFFDKDTDSGVVFLMNSGIYSHEMYLGILDILKKLAAEAGLN